MTHVEQSWETREKLQAMLKRITGQHWHIEMAPGSHQWMAHGDICLPPVEAGEAEKVWTAILKKTNRCISQPKG